MVYDVLVRIRVGGKETSWTITATYRDPGARTIETTDRGAAADLRHAWPAIQAAWPEIPPPTRGPSAGWYYEDTILVWAGTHPVR